MVRASFRWAALLMLGVAVGCQDMNWNFTGKPPVTSIKATHAALGTAAEDLQATNAALDRLSTTSDLPAWLQEYSKSIAKLEKAGHEAKDRWAQMKSNGQAYIDHWEKEIGETSNPQIQETMEQRRQRVTEKFEGIRRMAEQVRDAYPPYLADLKDIEKALKVDLTANGVKALGPSVAEAKAGGEAIMKKLDEVGIALDQLAGKLSAK